MAIKGNHVWPLKQNKLSQRFTEALISAEWLQIKLKMNFSQVEMSLIVSPVVGND